MKSNKNQERVSCRYCRHAQLVCTGKYDPLLARCDSRITFGKREVMVAMTERTCGYYEVDMRNKTIENEPRHAGI